MSEFTQGMCADGAAILKDGVMLAIEEIIELLRQGDALMGRGEPVAIAKTRREFHEYENSALEDEVGYLVTHVNWVKKPQDVGELKLYTQAPAVDDAAIREAIRTMDDGERLDIFSEYCRCCGSNDPTCQCWNDE